MQKKYTTRPLAQGSVISFIVIGIVLIGLLVGGISLIKYRANQAANIPPNITQSAPNKGKTTTQPAPTTQAAPKTTVPSTPQAAPATQTPSASSAVTTPLASTGPTETFATTLILGIITAMAARYLQSRSQPVRQ